MHAYTYINNIPYKHGIPKKKKKKIEQTKLQLGLRKWKKAHVTFIY